MAVSSRETVVLSQETREFCYKFLKGTHMTCVRMSSINGAVCISMYVYGTCYKVKG